MTIKQRIDAFVLNQGNQVGAGAELAAILKDIIDAIPGEYTLPPASAQTLGGVKVGENLSITEQGVLSAGGGGITFIEGTIEDQEFLPNSGQLTKTEAVTRMKNGELLAIIIPDEDEPTKKRYYFISRYIEVDNEFTFDTIVW